MVNLNLLPDIKKEYLRSQRVKRMFIAGSLLVSAVFVGLVVLLASFVFGVQKLHLSQVNQDIADAQWELEQVPELDKIVTIQRQLDSLPGLHESRPAATRLFNYFSVLVPEQVNMSKTRFDFDVSSAEITGVTDTTKSVNEFVDTLKNATFTYDGLSEPMKPFSSVVLNSITVERGADEVIYQITVLYDGILFDDTITNPKLAVPKITSSQSVTERPNLFQQPESSEEQ